MTDHEVFYGVDRRKVEVIMAKARRERNAAMREFFKGLFKRAERKDGIETPTAAALR